MTKDEKLSVEWKAKKTIYSVLFKRPIDFFGALVLLIVSSPIILITAIMVLIKHGSPVLFKQKRVGKNRKVFLLAKFRSMNNKKDANGELLPDSVRLTKFGKFLRKTSLDELPQLFLVLIGKMSFIGPRPMDVKICVFLNDEQCRRFTVKPGITGYAQVNGRNNIDDETKVKLDADYAKKITFLGDVKIIFQTIAIVLKRKGIENSSKGGNHLCPYYNEDLLASGRITQGEYERMKEFAKTLQVKDIMPAYAGAEQSTAIVELGKAISSVKEDTIKEETV